MIKRFNQLPLNIKLMIAFAIILIAGIIIRWNYIKREATRSFSFFKHDHDTVMHDNTQLK
jgi:hypothetical protein